MGCLLCKIDRNGTRTDSPGPFPGYEEVQSGRPHHGGVKYSDDYSDSERDMGGHGQDEGGQQDEPGHHDEGQPDIENNHPDEMDDSGEANQHHPGEAALPKPLSGQVDGPSQDQPGATLRDARVLVTLSSETVSWNGTITIAREIVLTSGIEEDSDAWKMMQEQLGVAGWA